MKPHVIAALLLAAGPSAARAQQPADLGSLLEGGRRWLEENVDTNVLQQLPELDEAEAERLLRRIDEALRGEEVLDLGRLRGMGQALLPWVEQDETLRPFAPWLRSRMDYLEASEQLNRLVPAAPKPTREIPSPKRAAPTEEQQKRVWARVVATEPAPPAARKLLPRLKSAFAAEGVPAELVWVAEVESSFDPKARSPAGAAGLFQLMPETARGLGLSTFPIDQRYDPDHSAAGAAKLLKRLRVRFRDWPLALAAYNAGEGRVGGLLTRHKATRFPEIARFLPAETQMYVPKIDAVLRRREGKGLGEIR
jgi:membrane-bound lytic murein transglycosylase D